MKFKRPRKGLIDGYKIGYPGKKFVCCKDTWLKEDVLIGVKGEHMIIRKGEKPVTKHGSFKDKFGREDYFLVYYEWKPTKKTKAQIEADEKKEHDRAVSKAQQRNLL